MKAVSSTLVVLSCCITFFAFDYLRHSEFKGAGSYLSLSNLIIYSTRSFTPNPVGFLSASFHTGPAISK